MKKYLISISISIYIIIGVLILYNGYISDTKLQQDNEILQGKDIHDTIKKKEKVLDELELENGDKVQLIYNGNVAISLNNEMLVLDTDIPETMIFNNKGMPNVEFQLHKITANNYIETIEYYIIRL